jgi:hypothetical protein
MGGQHSRCDVATNPLQSAPRRFIQKFGVAFFWALVLGLAFGGGSFFRLERRELEGEPRWHVYPRLWLERSTGARGSWGSSRSAPTAWCW